MGHDWREKKHEHRTHTHSSSKYNMQWLWFVRRWHFYVLFCFSFSLSLFSCSMFISVLVFVGSNFISIFLCCSLFSFHEKWIPHTITKSFFDAHHLDIQFHLAMPAFIIAFTYASYSVRYEWTGIEHTSFIINKMLIFFHSFFLSENVSVAEPDFLYRSLSFSLLLTPFYFPNSHTHAHYYSFNHFKP